MIKVQLPQGSIIEIDGSAKRRDVVLRCRQKPALARVLTDMLDLRSLPDGPEAELHVANKVIQYYKEAQVIEASPEHYAPIKGR
ncbi:MAG: hypothetical protein AB1696_24180 [Planctomycetota bacterium]